MKYVLIVLVALITSCSRGHPPMPIPPQESAAATQAIDPAAWPVTLPEVEVFAPKEPKAVKPAKPDARNPCSDIEGEDVKESINLKLDCMERSLK